MGMIWSVPEEVVWCSGYNVGWNLGDLVKSSLSHGKFLSAWPMLQHCCEDIRGIEEPFRSIDVTKCVNIENS